MFHLVDFKGGRARTVVPDTWLSINDTLCLLPPKVSDQALEVMARNRVEPGEGWQIFGVKSLQTFESYSDAKKQMERPKETPQSQAETQRKRKKPGYLEDYDVLDSGGGQQQSYTVFRTVEDVEEDVSEDEWEPTSAPQFMPRVNRVSSCQRMIQNYGNKRRIMQFNQSRPPFRKQTVEVKCACKSSCHGTILQALQSMQNQLDKTNQMVQQLLMARPKPTQQFKPQRSLFRPPYNHVSGQDETEAVSQDDTSFLQSLFQNQDTSAAQRRTETTTSFTADEETSYMILDRPSISEADIMKKIDIRKWLMCYPKGAELMLKLDSEIFFPKDRQLLVRIVCKKLIEECGNAYPTSQIKEQVAKEIVKAFPFLKSSRGAGHEAFYDLKTGNGFIGYRLKTIRKSFPFEEKRNNPSVQMQKLADEGCTPKGIVAVKEEILSPSDLEENVAWMEQQNPDEENKTLIVAKLKETMKNRQKEIKETDMSVADIFNRYPRLKDYKGEMITMEFSELFSNGEKFLETFKSYFAPRILSYVTLHKPLLLLHVPNCEDNLKSLLLLPELLPVPNYKRTNQSPRGSKPNARKIPNPDLIVFVKSEEQFIKVTEDTESQSLQPFLICVNSPQESGGSNKKYFIRVDETVIEAPDEPMAAFDVLFKLHYVFNIQYAKSLENFYNFVSSIIYEIDTPRSSSDAFYTLLRNIPISIDESSP